MSKVNKETEAQVAVEEQEEAEEESTRLALLPSIPNALAVFGQAGGTDPLYDEIEAKVRSIPLDIADEDGRKQVKSVAYQIARTKTGIDEAGKALVSDIKAKVGVIDAERKRIRDKLDALKDEIRQPLTDWENVQQRRIDNHASILEQIGELHHFQGSPSSEQVKQRLVQMKEMFNRDWEEFSSRAKHVYETVEYWLNKKLDAVTKEEEEAREALRLRQVEEEERRLAREEQIRKEAAEKAKKEAEARARKIKEQAEERARKAEEDTKRAEEARKLAEQRAKQAEKEREEHAKRMEEEAKKRAAKAKEESDKRAAEAVRLERERVEKARLAEEEAEKKREANKKHRTKIEKEAIDAIVKMSINEGLARRIIEAISQDKIPHIAISY